MSVTPRSKDLGTPFYLLSYCAQVLYCAHRYSLKILGNMATFHLSMYVGYCSQNAKKKKIQKENPTVLTGSCCHPFANIPTVFLKLHLIPGNNLLTLQNFPHFKAVINVIKKRRYCTVLSLAVALRGLEGMASVISHTQKD